MFGMAGQLFGLEGLTFDISAEWQDFNIAVEDAVEEGTYKGRHFSKMGNGPGNRMAAEDAEEILTQGG